MNTILNYLNTASNYSVYNNNNIYNFLFIVMCSLNEQERIRFIEQMRINVGLTFTNDFKLYIFKKLPNSVLLNSF